MIRVLILFHHVLYTSGYVVSITFLQYLLVITLSHLGGAIPPSSTRYQGLSETDIPFIYYITKKTYWDNTLNSFEGISIITRKGLKNEY